MKVAMVMPMSPESAIADVMTQAVPDLSLQWDLDIWCPAESTHRPSSVPLIPYALPNEEVIDALSGYDLVVYVLGDSPRHTRILPLAQHLPGLTVLHDASLTNLVRQAAVETDTMDVLVQHVRATAGPEAAELLAHPDTARSPSELLELCAAVPLDDYAVENSLGIVVHSRWHGERIDGLVLGDVTVAPLPVPSARLSVETNRGPDPARLLASLPSDSLLLVTVGNLNANRRVEVLLQAIADDPTLASRVHLWAVGPAESNAAVKPRRPRRPPRRVPFCALFSVVTVLSHVAHACPLSADVRRPREAYLEYRQTG